MMACDFCKGEEPIYEHKDDFCKIDGNRIVAKVMAMGVLFGSPSMMNHGFSASINFCPMCGHDLRGESE